MNDFIKKNKYCLYLVLAMVLFSFTSIFSKLASKEEFLSFKYIFFYGMIIFVLGLYAIVWQQILKKVELSVAMSFKPLVIIFNLLWAILFFHSECNIKIIIGFVLILVGIVIIGKKNV